MTASIPVQINPEDVVDWDIPLNDSPDFISSHVFSTDDVTATFSGVTHGNLEDGETPIIDFSADPQVGKDGTELYPINSEFGFIVTDFADAEQKTLDGNPEYEEGWIGDLTGESGEQIGVVVSDAETDTFKTPAVLGTWLSGLGGSSVKASTEHYVVMQNVLSDQLYPGDPDALYPLDDDLYVIGGTYDGMRMEDAIGLEGDSNGDGVADIKDVLAPNETSITEAIAASSDYSVTLKDDGKLLFRWGNMIKKPNDIRLQAELDLPTEWSMVDPESGLPKLFKVSEAELLVHHTITNNPNDQIRPEDYENEEAIGRLPSFEEREDGAWVTVEDFYAGDGTLYPAGTVLKDPSLPAQIEGTLVEALGTASEDLQEGFTNAYYTILDRAPFEAVIGEDGDYEIGPRWRLKPDKYGQDLPSVTIPADPQDVPPVQNGEEKYEVGAETQTVLNLLDWDGISPLTLSAGWQHNSGTVSENGVNLSPNFDVAVYIKGDKKAATLYSTSLVMSHEEVDVAASGVAATGTSEDDVLAGRGGNSFTGGEGDDLFVLSYGVTDTTSIEASTINDFEVGSDMLSLVGFGIEPPSDEDPLVPDEITQVVDGGNLVVSLEGTELVTLSGITEVLEADSFQVLNPSFEPFGPDTIFGTDGDDMLVGTPSVDTILGLAGNDTITGRGGEDLIYGGDGDDYIDGGIHDDALFGGAGNDTILGMSGNDTIDAGSGDDVVSGNSGDDIIDGGDGDDALSGGTDNDILLGGVGDDEIRGDTGDDVLYGEDGNDILRAGDGNDILDGGSGADVLTGFLGADIFVYNTAEWGNDTILDFEAGLDTLDFTGSGLALDDLQQVEFSEGLLLTYSDDVVSSTLFMVGVTSAELDASSFLA